MAQMRYSLFLLPAVAACRLWRRLQEYVLSPLRTAVISRLWKMKCREGVRFLGRTIIRAYDRGAIEIGRNVIFNSRVNVNLVGLVGPTILCASKGAKIRIGDESGFSSVVINSRGAITIGSNVKVGGNVRIFDHDFHPIEWQARRRPEDSSKTRVRPVVIEDDVFIGTNTIVLKGTHIGARSVVAAGSVVFGLNVPPDSLVKGNPAVIVERSVKREQSNVR